MSEQAPIPEGKPEKEVTEYDKEMMQRNLEALRSNKEWGSFAQRATELKILFPEMDSAKDLGVDEEAKREMRKGMEAVRKEKKDPYVFAWAQDIKILCPETDVKKDLGLDKDDKERLKADLNVCRRGGNWGQFAEEAMAGKIIWPELDVEDLGINKETIAGMKEEIQKDREWLRPDGTKGDWNKFFTQAMAIRVLCPEVDPEKDLGIDDEAREGAKKDAETWRNGRWTDFSQLAAARKVAEAKEVEVIDKGLEITSPEK